MTETWLSWCIKRPGPEWKQGYGGVKVTPLGQKEGEVKHSAEGPLSALFSELDRPDRQASWGFSLAKAGPVYQHYPLESMTWHAGLPGDRRVDTSLIGNMVLIGEEHEGGGPGNPGEPLTEAQYQASLRLSRDTRALCPLVGAKPPTLKLNLWEHNWLSWTSCPSGRIPWQRLIADLEEDMDEATVNRLIDAKITANNGSEWRFNNIMENLPDMNAAQRDIVRQMIEALAPSGGGLKRGDTVELT